MAATNYKFKGNDETARWQNANVDRIAGISKANDVDMGVASDMLASNLSGKSNYAGGGNIERQEQENLYSQYQKARETDRDRGALASVGSVGGRSGHADTFSYSSGNPYQDLLDAQAEQYDSLRKNAQEASMLATEQSVSRLESGKADINQGYDDANRQAYINKMQALKANPQALASQGVTGGLAESSLVDIESSYGEAVNENEQSRRKALTDIDQAIIEARNTGDLALAEQLLSIKQQEMADRQNLYAQRMAYEADQEAREMENYYATIGAYSDNYQKEINRLLSLGVPEDDYRVKMLKTARQDKLATQRAAQVEAEQQAFENDLALRKLYKTSSGSGSGSGDTGLTYSQAYAQLKSGGLLSAAAYQALLDSGLTDGEISANAKYHGTALPNMTAGSMESGIPSSDQNKYIEVKGLLDSMMASGQSREEVLAALQDFRYGDYISAIDYLNLYDLYGLGR